MESQDVKEHWRDWATTHGTGFRATSMCETIKMLEIDALARRIDSLPPNGTLSFTVLEAGCGNGMNCIELAKRFPGLRFYGFDYLPEMVEAARKNAKDAEVQDRVRFVTADILNLAIIIKSDLPLYDVVISNRLIINLNTVELQRKGIQILASKVRLGGHLLLIENSITMRDEQNRLRGLLRLPARPVAPFNRFVTEDEIQSHLDSAGLDLIEIEDFMSLHDLLLYVLIPALNGGHVDYEHPLVKIATELSLKTNPNAFGSWGQNRLFVCRKSRNA